MGRGLSPETHTAALTRERTFSLSKKRDRALTERADPDEVERLLHRAYELAESSLDGINQASLELADLSGEDVAVLEAARHLVVERLATRPDHATKQVASLIRRAFELGNWRWKMDETNEVP